VCDAAAMAGLEPVFAELAGVTERAFAARECLRPA
jgi:hypothetical protein